MDYRTDKWTDEEIEFLVANTGIMSDAEISAKLNRGPRSIAMRRYKLKGRKAKLACPTPTADGARKTESESYWENRYRLLSREFGKLSKEVAVIDRLVDTVKQIAPVSYDPHPPVVELGRSQTTPESAVLMLSDTHFGKDVRPEQTLGFGGYNFRTGLDRLKFVERHTLSILTEHSSSPINELVVAMLGDMMDGALMHGSEVGQLSPLFNQFFGAGHALAQFLRNLAGHLPKVRVETCVGNHTRWGNQKKMPTVNRYSNLDQFLYAYVQALTNDIPNIVWNLDQQPFAIFDVEGWAFFAAHGDHWRGGDKTFGIPLHAMGRQVNATTQLFYQNTARVPNYYLSGHLHRPIQIPTGVGDLTVNGGFPGIDNYSLSGNFNPVDPLQILFKVHPTYGKTAEYKLQLKHAKPSKDGYVIPPGFECS
jgi:hypothetical protein